MEKLDRLPTPEIHKTGGRDVPVYFVPKKRLEPWYGMAYGHITDEKCCAMVRDDLPRIVKRFILQHELYHLRDRYKWWGVLGAEIRANFVPALRDPIGALVFLGYCLIYYNRLGIYLYRFKGK